MLWRITRDGRSSYLFGTLHVGRPAWRDLGPRTAAAWRQTDVLALELDPTDPAVIAALLVESSAPYVTRALNERLAGAAVRACLPATALASLHPVLQATTLTVLEARWIGLDPLYAIESLLAQRARAGQRRVVSLESVELQKAALVPAEPADAIALIEQSLAQIHDGTSRRVLQRLVAAWETGDVALLEDYVQWCECAANDDDRAFIRRLNDERNGALADGIEALHQQGRRVFAAVGALHMTGERALPRLMAARGFKVERIPFGR